MYLDRDNPGDYPLEEQVRCIREIGLDRVILTSDAGQKRNPSSSESIKAYLKLLAEKGLGESDFKAMLQDNPKRILGK